MNVFSLAVTADTRTLVIAVAVAFGVGLLAGLGGYFAILRKKK